MAETLNKHGTEKKAQILMMQLARLRTEQEHTKDTRRKTDRTGNKEGGGVFGTILA